MTDEERNQRIHHHMYETCEGIAEHAERIVALEELCVALHEHALETYCHGGSTCSSYCVHASDDDGCARTGKCWYERRMDELGVPHD